jgi:hypothetical protein
MKESVGTRRDKIGEFEQGCLYLLVIANLIEQILVLTQPVHCHMN